MNLLHLKYVISIAENGSINKAAEELHVAQPNLSRVVREMEGELGIRFFHRSSRGMLLTPDGELFVNQARRILEQVDEMESLYKERKAGTRLREKGITSMKQFKLLPSPYEAVMIDNFLSLYQ